MANSSRKEGKNIKGNLLRKMVCIRASKLQIFDRTINGREEKFRMTNLEWGVDFFIKDKFSQDFLRWTNLVWHLPILTFS